MEEKAKCQTGCKAFTSGEIYHHKDCFHYPESFSSVYDELKLQLSESNEKYKKCIKVIKRLDAEMIGMYDL